MQSGFGATLMSIAVISAFLLVVGGIRLLVRRERFKGALMITAAIVLIGNVAIWTVPL